MNIRRKLALASAFALFPLLARAVDNPGALLTRLHSAETQTAIDDPALKPWHLKLTIQLFNDEGKPAEQGTIEEWWAGPTQQKIVYSFPSFEQVILQNEKGRFVRKLDAYAPPDANLLLHQIVHPVPAQDLAQPARPELRKQKFGQLTLDCIALLAPVPSAHEDPSLAPSFCLSPDTDALRLSFQSGYQIIIRNLLGKFQNREVSTEVTAKLGDIFLGTAKVVTLATFSPDDSFFTSAEGLTPAPEASVQLAGNVVQGSKINGGPPIYPMAAKMQHVGGRVILHAVIGRDGHIKHLVPIYSSNPLFTESAKAAVATWTYKPYLLNGQPAEVDTVVTVNYTFGN